MSRVFDSGSVEKEEVVERDGEEEEVAVGLIQEDLLGWILGHLQDVEALLQWIITGRDQQWIPMFHQPATVIDAAHRL
jgi:hypothetical protein